MASVENFREYAADCVRQAEGETSPEDKNILLNMALAWVRLAHQKQTVSPSVGEAIDHEGTLEVEVTSAEIERAH